MKGLIHFYNACADKVATGGGVITLNHLSKLELRAYLYARELVASVAMDPDSISLTRPFAELICAELERIEKEKEERNVR